MNEDIKKIRFHLHLSVVSNSANMSTK